MVEAGGIDAGLVGGLIGLVIGLASYFFFSSIYVDLMEERSGKPQPLWRLIAYADVIFYPVVGYAIGSYLF